MKESKLQAEMVMAFSQEYPELDGLLWSTRNTTFSQRDGQKQKAMGMKAGVSDLMFYFQGTLYCFEIKAHGSTHSKDHIRRQMEWGKSIEFNSGKWFICKSKESFLIAIKSIVNNDWGLLIVEDLLSRIEVEYQLYSDNSKTIKF